MIELNEKDIYVLKKLGEKISEIAQKPIMKERKKSWRELNRLKSRTPMILTETHGILDEILPMEELECEDQWAKEIERGLKDKILHYEYINDDTVIEPRITYAYKISKTNFGLDVIKHNAESNYGKGAYRWDPPITDISEGLKKLSFRKYSICHDETNMHVEKLQKVFNGILPVVHRGWYMWTQGLTIDLIDLIGLEGLLYAFYDQPDELHQLMAFMRDEQINKIKWFESQGLLFPNNEDDYVGSGGCGYTDELPKEGYIPGKPGRLIDMWGLSESQETTNISPEMFEEFIFPYQLPIISHFGLACYGCCEPLDNRWKIIKKIPNLRRVSISPWSNQNLMATNLQTDYIFSRKPNPAYISTDLWDETLIRKDIRETLEITKGLNVELIMKDVHTVKKDRFRMKRWVEIAREEIERVYT